MVAQLYVSLWNPILQPRHYFTAILFHTDWNIIVAHKRYILTFWGTHFVKKMPHENSFCNIMLPRLIIFSRRCEIVSLQLYNFMYHGTRHFFYVKQRRHYSTSHSFSYNTGVLSQGMATGISLFSWQVFTNGKRTNETSPDVRGRRVNVCTIKATRHRNSEIVQVKKTLQNYKRLLLSGGKNTVNQQHNTKRGGGGEVFVCWFDCRCAGSICEFVPS